MASPTPSEEEEGAVRPSHSTQRGQSSAQAGTSQSQHSPDRGNGANSSSSQHSTRDRAEIRAARRRGSDVDEQELSKLREERQHRREQDWERSSAAMSDERRNGSPSSERRPQRHLVGDMYVPGEDRDRGYPSRGHGRYPYGRHDYDYRGPPSARDWERGNSYGASRPRHSGGYDAWAPPRDDRERAAYREGDAERDRYWAGRPAYDDRDAGWQARRRESSPRREREREQSRGRDEGGAPRDGPRRDISPPKTLKRIKPPIDVSADKAEGEAADSEEPSRPPPLPSTPPRPGQSAGSSTNTSGIQPINGGSAHVKLTNSTSASACDGPRSPKRPRTLSPKKEDNGAPANESKVEWPSLPDAGSGIEARKSRKPRVPLRERRFHGCSSIDMWDVGQKLGQGTFGVVEKAKHRITGIEVALKKVTIHDEKDGFPLTAIREIKLLKRLSHPSIVPVIDMAYRGSGERGKPGEIFMVEPYMDHDLNGMLENPSISFTMPQIKLYMKQLLEGTLWMHQNKILHRDMKAANLLINNQGQLQIADFGLARPYHDAGKAWRAGGWTKGSHQYTGMVVTRWYRPPELLAGEKLYGPPIDMWGLGCILAEMINRKPIFKGTSEIHQLELISMLCGSPNEENYPGWNSLPGVKNADPEGRTNPGPEVPGQHDFGHYPRRVIEHFTVAPLQVRRELADLIDKLLVLDPRKRMTAEEALNHEWFWQPPYPALASALPKYEASKEIDRQRRDFRPPPAAAPDLGAMGAGGPGGMGGGAPAGYGVGPGRYAGPPPTIGGGGGGAYGPPRRGLGPAHLYGPPPGLPDPPRHPRHSGGYAASGAPPVPTGAAYGGGGVGGAGAGGGYQAGYGGGAQGQGQGYGAYGQQQQGGYGVHPPRRPGPPSRGPPPSSSMGYEY